ncbi:RNA-directed DNA polymerase, eukaryota, Reverse transcriptase zinc-binding domain protein [Artemisia annua]|uniref:RNA-directed DNA polymerase, eukaryota, Reverse transcriptase zinc-binding domain protein n=1 Tax=Artemisia annua TaxID=35608 RepID=A0A2U1PAT2_ARTAN|nr:RNA-directed DNA polymerase, eukaryota, Reverse transcriptase zinc-binding domain protein [Artemisia annua]
MTRLELFRIKSMWGNYAFDYACSMSRGRSGGLISVWDPNYFVKDQIWCDDCYIIVQGKWANSDDVFFMINIYGPHEMPAKSSLWSRMLDFIATHEGDSNQCLTFHEKLKYIKQKIKAWIHNAKQGDVSRYQEVKLRLIEIEEKIDERVASDEERQERMNLLKECDDLNKLEQMDTFQKARVKWDVEGDENSKIFHRMLKQKRHQQTVKGIMINGEWVTNPQHVKMAFMNFYKEKFDDHASTVNFSPVTPQSRLNEVECSALECRLYCMWCLELLLDSLLLDLVKFL